ncbi:unnamed protein product, partial [marine sediment metagenome]
FFDTAELKTGVDYDVFVIPPVDSSLGSVVIYELSPIMMSANAKSREAAGKFIDFWLSPEGQSIWCNEMNFISANSAVSKDNLDLVKQKIAKDVFES